MECKLNNKNYLFNPRYHLKVACLVQDLGFASVIGQNGSKRGIILLETEKNK